MNTTTNYNIPIGEKYSLSVSEAAQYFRIGEKKLYDLAKDNPDAKWLLRNGNRVQFKRAMFEKYLDGITII
ncbi:MAG: excisionase [Oscillospiraceae bacterium]|nr:excisionase [Oscillospiraceae bacterium]